MAAVGPLAPVQKMQRRERLPSTISLSSVKCRGGHGEEGLARCDGYRGKGGGRGSISLSSSQDPATISYREGHRRSGSHRKGGRAVARDGEARRGEQ
jgi:hypothetical protein